MNRHKQVCAVRSAHKESFLVIYFETHGNNFEEMHDITNNLNPLETHERETSSAAISKGIDIINEHYKKIKLNKNLPRNPIFKELVKTGAYNFKVAPLRNGRRLDKDGKNMMVMILAFDESRNRWRQVGFSWLPF
jgi:hypothetical protein